MLVFCPLASSSPSLSSTGGFLLSPSSVSPPFSTSLISAIASPSVGALGSEVTGFPAWTGRCRPQYFVVQSIAQKSAFYDCRQLVALLVFGGCSSFCIMCMFSEIRQPFGVSYGVTLVEGSCLNFIWPVTNQRSWLFHLQKGCIPTTTCRGFGRLFARWQCLNCSRCDRFISWCTMESVVIYRKTLTLGAR